MSLFNRFIKRQFATPNARKELFKNSFILLLVLFAGNIVYESAIEPYLIKNNLNAGNDSSIDDTPYFEEERSQDTDIKLTNVETSKIFWNDKPKRDPFSLHILKGDELKQALKSATNQSNYSKAKSRSKANKRFKPPPILSGIVRGLDSNFVVLNGEIIKVGQIIKGFKVINIMNKSVKIKRQADARLFTLFLETE